jgi:uncharacterized protein (DUF302 family)
MKKAILFVAALMTAQFAQAQLGGLLKKAEDKVNAVKNGGVGALSQEEVGNGLKEALNIGLSEATQFLSAKDGYFKSPYKILLPEEAKKVVSKLKMVPAFANVEADLTERMNRAAEDAAQKAKPIFIAAIKNMSFADALNILKGNPDAATRFLEKSTYAALYAEFKPIVQASLDKVNARSYWTSATTAYNKIPLVTKTNPELDDHVTKMALIGLFSLVEQKEKGIRSDSKLRTSDLLKKVFAQQDKK